MNQIDERMANCDVCFRCGKQDHKLWEYLVASQKVRDPYQQSQCIFSAALEGCLTQKTASSSVGGEQCHRMCYTLMNMYDHNASPNVYTSILQICNIHVYVLLDPKDIFL